MSVRVEFWGGPSDGMRMMLAESVAKGFPKVVESMRAKEAIYERDEKSSTQSYWRYVWRPKALSASGTGDVP